MKKALSFLLAFLCLSLCACGGSSTEETTAEPTYSQEELTYHDTMAAYLDAVDPSQVTGKKAVVVMVDSFDPPVHFYTRQYLPEELIAESPEEVRYMIECYEEVRNVGMYINGGQAYQYFLHANIVDLKYKLAIGGPSVWGSEPPESVSEPGDYYGSRPGFEKLGAAIAETVMNEIREYEKTLCANCGIQLQDQYVCCPECGTFR